jgi:hypothetical protein
VRLLDRAPFAVERGFLRRTASPDQQDCTMRHVAHLQKLKCMVIRRVLMSDFGKKSAGGAELSMTE